MENATVLPTHKRWEYQIEGDEQPHVLTMTEPATREEVLEKIDREFPGSPVLYIKRWRKKSAPALSGFPDEIVREDVRAALTGRPRSSWYVLEIEAKQRGDTRFPKKYRIGSRSVGWKRAELVRWVEEQAEDMPEVRMEATG